MTYRFTTECPRCGRVGEATSDQPQPRMHCVDCLIDDIEVVIVVCTPLAHKN